MMTVIEQSQKWFSFARQFWQVTEGLFNMGKKEVGGSE